MKLPVTQTEDEVQISLFHMVGYDVIVDAIFGTGLDRPVQVELIFNQKKNAYLIDY